MLDEHPPPAPKSTLHKCRTNGKNKQCWFRKRIKDFNFSRKNCSSQIPLLNTSTLKRHVFSFPSILFEMPANAILCVQQNYLRQTARTPEIRSCISQIPSCGMLKRRPWSSCRLARLRVQEQPPSRAPRLWKACPTEGLLLEISSLIFKY